MVPLKISHCSGAEHSGDNHFSGAEQQQLQCSLSEHDILDRCSGSEQGSKSNNEMLKCETSYDIKQFSLFSGQENMIQTFVQPEQEQVTPTNVSANEGADNLSSQNRTR